MTIHLNTTLEWHALGVVQINLRKYNEMPLKALKSKVYFQGSLF